MRKNNGMKKSNYMKKVISLVLCFAMMFCGMAHLPAREVRAASSVMQIYDSESEGGLGNWYKNTSFSDEAYMEIVEEGCEDAGALHVVAPSSASSSKQDLMIVLRNAVWIPEGTYTVKYNIKGSVGYVDTNNVFGFRMLNTGNPYFHFCSSDNKSFTTWTSMTGTYEAVSGALYLPLQFSQYNSTTDVYIDNLQLLNADNEDMLKGAGNFGSGPNDSDYELMTLADNAAAAGTAGWYKNAGGGKTYTDTEYMEIVKEGCDDPGALHIRRTTDGQGEVSLRARLVNNIPVGTYKLRMMVKGSVGVVDSLDFSQYGYSTFRIIKQKSYENWTLVESDSFTVQKQGADIMIGAGVYLREVDFYIDNIQLLDADNNNVMGDHGNFCIKKYTEPEDPELLKISDTVPSTEGWYRNWLTGSGEDTAFRYMEIAKDGCVDKGSLHIVNGAPAGDMQISVKLAETVPAGTYTLKMYVKGNVKLTNQAFRFQETYSDKHLFDLITRTVYDDWTEVMGTFETDGSNQYAIFFSQYNNVTDIYIDNIRLIDAAGKDWLNGLGSFCTDPQVDDRNTAKTVPALTGSDASGFELTIPEGSLIGTITSEDGIYINGTAANSGVVLNAAPDGALRLNYTASEGDMLTLDGTFSDNYYARRIGPVTFCYQNGAWNNMLAGEDADFYFFESDLANATFDEGISGWNDMTASDGTSLVYDATGYEGGAAKVAHSADGATSYALWADGTVTVRAGETWHLRMLVKAEGAVKLGAALVNADTKDAVAIHDSGIAIADGTDGWQQLNYAFTIPADAEETKVKAALKHVFSETAAVVCYDNVAFYKEYQPGDVNGDDARDIRDLVRYKSVDSGLMEYASKNAADMNGNRYINAVDTAVYKRYLLGIEDTAVCPPETVVLAPEAFYPYNDIAKAYLTTSNADVREYAAEMTDSAKDIIIPLDCLADDATFTAECGLKADYSDAVTVHSDKPEIVLRNLYKGKTYYIRVTATANGMTRVTASTFKTTDIGPRVVQAGGIVNMRDLGGYVTSSGRMTVQGLAFRGAQPDTKGSSLLTEEGQKVMSEEIGVKLDIDLRTASEASNITGSFIDSAKYLRSSIGSYSAAFDASQKDLWRQIFASYADVNNYPIYVHCLYGADRTGTVCYILNALCEVSDEDLIRDYEYTSFSESGLRYATSSEMSAFLQKFQTLEGDTTAKKAETYLLSIGVTADEIANIKAIMLGDLEVPGMTYEDGTARPASQN